MTNGSPPEALPPKQPRLTERLLAFIPSAAGEIIATQAFRDASKVFFANGFATAISLIGIFIIQKIIAVRELGTLAIYNNLLSLSTGIILGGITTSFVRYLSQYYERDLGVAKLIARRVLAIVLGLGVLTFIMFTFGSELINRLFFGQEDLESFIQLVGVGSLTTVVTVYYTTIFQTQQRFTAYSAIIFGQAIGGALAVVLLYFTNHLTTSNVILTNIAITAAAGSVSYLLYRRSGLAKAPRATPPPMLFHEMVHFSTWVVIMSIVSVVFTKVDVMMLSAMVSLEEVAIYSFASSIYLAFLLILGAMNTILLPRISRLQTAEEFRAAAARVLRLSAFVAVTTVPLFFLVAPLVHLVFQNKFDDALPLIYLLLGSLSVSILLNPSVNFLIVMKRERFMAISAIAMVLINVAGNLLFIPTYRAIGAVSVTAITIVIVNIVQFIEFRRCLLRYSDVRI